MLLAVDIGNTNINFALIKKSARIYFKYSTPSGNPNLKPILNKKKIDEVIIVSVVPQVTDKIKNIIKNKFKKAKIYVVGKNVKVPMKCAYSKKEIGQDRLVTAFAAEILYGLPILIIDFGTAVTFDVVSKKNVYEGGLIVPGIKMSLESLAERTAMLPRTYLKKTNTFIGKSTSSSIRNGMIYGYGSLCEGLIKNFKKHVSRKIKVVATGGDSVLISRYAPSIKNINLNLSLIGLFLLSKYNPYKNI